MARTVKAGKFCNCELEGGEVSIVVCIHCGWGGACAVRVSSCVFIFLFPGIAIHEKREKKLPEKY
jgi:hypothetical protein